MYNASKWVTFSSIHSADTKQMIKTSILKFSLFNHQELGYGTLNLQDFLSMTTKWI